MRLQDCFGTNFANFKSKMIGNNSIPVVEKSIALDILKGIRKAGQ
jgi:hypothetical protein